MRGVNKTRTSLARKLRRESTTAERRLWNRLRSRSIDGHKFVRQQPIGRFVVDFICRQQRLIIEVDGSQHAESALDQARDQWFRERNYRVLRFWINEVLGKMDGVLETVAAALREESPPHPVYAFGGNRPLPASGER